MTTNVPLGSDVEITATIPAPPVLGGEPPAHRSVTTTIAAIASLAIGGISFVWGLTWLLVALDREAMPLIIGSLAIMALGVLMAVVGFVLFIRKPWAATVAKLTYGVSIAAVLFFLALSAVAQGLGALPYVGTVALVAVFAAVIVLLSTDGSRADFPDTGSRVIPTFALWTIVGIWTLPTLGLLLSSFRGEAAVKTEGWWTIITNPQLTFENYSDVLGSGGGQDAPNMFEHFLNSMAIVLPSTVIPIIIALTAAYAFAWMQFPGRKLLFVLVVSLMAVPLQVALIPLLQLYNGGAHIGSIAIFPDLDLGGETISVWLTHTGFGLPLAIFLLYNYVSGLPKDIFEAARIDGADHYTIFVRLVLPLSVPALAAFGIFQFLWTWNDYLIALTFLGNGDAAPLTVRLANLSGGRGQDWHVLTAAAFVSMTIPLIVFFSLQRYFVRGLLAGSVKG